MKHHCKKWRHYAKFSLGLVLGLGLFTTTMGSISHRHTIQTTTQLIPGLQTPLQRQSGNATFNSLLLTDPMFINNGQLGTYNGRNIYNVANGSLYYARAKSGASSKVEGNNFDRLVLVNNSDNSVKWTVTADDLATAITLKRTESRLTGASGASSTVAVSTTVSLVRLQGSVYSATAQAFFVSVFAVTNRSANTGHTVVFKIDQASGSKEVYFDANIEPNSMVLNGTSYKERDFNHIVIKEDGTNPKFLLISGNLTDRNSNVAAFGLNGKTYDSTTGITTSNLSDDFANVLTAGGKLTVTNAWVKNNTLVLVAFAQNNKATVSQNAAVFAFDLTNHNGLSNPSVAALTTLNDPNKQTFFNLVENSQGLFLNATSQQPKTGAFSSAGKLLVQKIETSTNNNQASVRVEKYETNVDYLAGTSLTSFTTALNNNTSLATQPVYVGVNANGVLVGLDQDFHYLQQITIASQIPATAKILDITNNGVNYLLHLSDGQILAYNNSGFVGNVGNLANAIESAAPIAFIPQSQITNGAQFTTKTFEEFKTEFEKNHAQFFVQHAQYNTVNYQPVYEFEFVKTPAPTDAAYHEEVTVNVYQKLRSLQADGQVNTTDTNGAKYFVGSNQYQLYSQDASVSLKDLSNTFIPQTRPSDVAAFYNSANNYQAAVRDLLQLSNVNVNDQANQKNNLSIKLTADDVNLSLTITVSLGYARSGGAQVNDKTFTLKFDGFNRNGNLLQELTYTINPKPKETLAAQFSHKLPSSLTPQQVITNFIQLSDQLAKYPRTISIVPKNGNGTALITVSFNFIGKNVFLTENKTDRNVLVTSNSITWETPQVFSFDPTLSDNVLFSFTPSEAILDKTVQYNRTTKKLRELKPSEIAKLFKTTTTNRIDRLSANLKTAIDDLGLIDASVVARDLIDDVQIRRVNDLLGSFKLFVRLKQSLPGSLSTQFEQIYRGFNTRTPTANDVFRINFTDDQAVYLERFKPTPTQNLFNRLPSSVTVDDLLQRRTNEPSLNGVQGWLIQLSAEAANAEPEISVSADNPGGNLLVSLFFDTYLEYDATTNKFQFLRNVKISRVISGFQTGAPVNEATGYFLNWKSSNDVILADTNYRLEQMTALAFADQVKNYSDYQIANLFANFSPEVRAKYQSQPNLIKSNLAVDNNQGTITVHLNFDQWENQHQVRSFQQKFSGFLIPQNAWENALKTFDPLGTIDLEAPQLLQLRSNTPVNQLSQTTLAHFYSFSGSIFNNLEKEIYFIFDAENGMGQIHFFVKTPQLASNPNTILRSNVPAIATALTPQLVDSAAVVQQADETKDASTKVFNTDAIPYQRLQANGFVELTHSGQMLEGFQPGQVTDGFWSSVLYIALAVGLPLLVFLPILAGLYFIWHRRATLFYERKLRRKLESEYRNRNR
ncbi:hypothetical protein J2Z62_000035 [Mycoplasmoides fastidiosum]|uniref:Uncharacterized protein n=1 Tax=Mycoplasmoides fastidiosum TaxID=92758 RepID=A0ABU0LY13_9BACT|nr:hypothetical protein [Mycoplasmoides fastidiosum]MDQ0513597.1 hypothetical protein [Mycoplasmoides fastidiosum]UUD37980.1 hypothetical protein NPA10_01120 [Mycoplasmoides fastidiosum]